MKISLISTMLNERHTVGPWLDSIRRQSRLPDEIVIVDGNSSDGTWEFLQAAAFADPLLSVCRESGGNISTGRNMAVRHAKHEIIAVTDQEAYRTAKRLSREEGIFAGISCGAACFAALQVAKTLGAGKKVVAIFPDSWERYLSLEPYFNI